MDSQLHLVHSIVLSLIVALSIYFTYAQCKYQGSTYHIVFVFVRQVLHTMFILLIMKYYDKELENKYKYRSTNLHKGINKLSQTICNCERIQSFYMKRIDTIWSGHMTVSVYLRSSSSVLNAIYCFLRVILTQKCPRDITYQCVPHLDY